MTTLDSPPTLIDSPVTDWLDDTSVRYEVIDGAVVVNPPPGFAHESVLAWVLIQLGMAAPADVSVLGSNYAFRYAQGSFTLSDITVVRTADAQEKGIYAPAAPLLLVEVRSPSTWRNDQRIKRSIFAEGGVGSYWLVDPRTPSLTILELDDDGSYLETAMITGSEKVSVSRPFPVTISLLRET